MDINQLLAMLGGPPAGPVQAPELTPGFRAPATPGMGVGAAAGGGAKGPNGLNVMDPLGILGSVLPSFNGRQMGQIRTGGGFGQTASDVFDVLQPPGSPGLNPVGLFNFIKEPSGKGLLGMLRPGLIPGLF